MPLPDVLKTPLSAVFNAIKSPLSAAMRDDVFERAPLAKGNSAFDDQQSEKVEFRIEGMTCGACVEVCTNNFFVVYLTADESARRCTRRPVNRRNA